MSVQQRKPEASPPPDGVGDRAFGHLRADRLERLTARAQALAEASRAFSEAAHDVEAALRVVARKTAELVGDGCTISLLSDDRRTLKMVAFHHVDPAELEATRTLLANVELPVSESIVGKVATTGEPFWLKDVTDGELRRVVHPRFHGFLDRVRFRSMLAVPLRVREEIIGTLTMSRGPSRSGYTSEDQDFLEDLAVRAALSIANARTLRRLQTELEERARAEEALRRTEEQLRQSQRMEAVGRLAGGIAHDFNNALTAILSAAELARGNLNAPEQVAGDLDVIAQAGNHAATLTRQLLLFSRHRVSQTKTLDLNAVVRGLEPMLRRLLPEDIEIATSLASNLGSIEADEGQIQQIVVNLAVNARDAMSEAGGRLAIETADVMLDDAYVRQHLVGRAGAHVMLAVRDTGHGMDAETLSHVFEPFFTTKKVGDGTGLGLATVYGIVEQGGGHVRVTSEPDHGTTFRVYFPAVAVSSSVALPGSRAARAAAGVKTILLVEDEPLVRKVARRILEGAAHRVLEAAGADEAEAVCQEHAGPIDLLLTDIVLRNANGRDLADQLRALRPDMKVLFMSGYTGHVMVRRHIPAPHMLLLEKPFTPESLLEKIDEALERS
ncbi:MAG TPA: ATP-binding protein [Polyangia bacterium]